MGYPTYNKCAKVTHGALSFPHLWGAINNNTYTNLPCNSYSSPLCNPNIYTTTLSNVCRVTSLASSFIHGVHIWAPQRIRHMLGERLKPQAWSSIWNMIWKQAVGIIIAAYFVLTIIAWFWSQVVCGVVAGLLHFFYLSAFCWMSLEGLELYLMLVTVFKTQVKTRYLLAMGYGVPTAIIIISAAVFPKGYGTEKQ